MRIDELVWRRPSRQPVPKAPRERDYDVSISSNRSGTKPDGTPRTRTVRFGFINQAKEALCGASHIRFTSVEDGADRIYFITANDKSSNAWLKLTRREKDKNPSPYTGFTPSPTEQEIIGTKWVGCYPLRYDDECDLNYIALEDRRVKTDESE